MQQRHSTKFSLYGMPMSMRDVLQSTKRAFEGQQKELEENINNLTEKTANLKTLITEYERKIAKSLRLKEELLTIESSRKTLTAKQQKELEYCNKNIECQPALLDAQKEYIADQEALKALHVQLELVKFNHQSINDQLNDQPRTSTPYNINPAMVRKVNKAVTELTKDIASKSHRPARAA